MRRLSDVHCRIRSLKSSKKHTRSLYTVIANGAQVTLIGYRDWIIKNKHQTWIKSSGAVGTQSTETLRLVDALSTLVNHAGDAVAIGQLYQGVYCSTSEQSLIAEDQLEWNGVRVESRVKHFGGEQPVHATHPATKKPLRLELAWDGSTKYLLSRKPTKEELKKLPVIVLTLDTPYDPKVSMNVRNIRRMVTHRNRAFTFHEPAGRKLAWTPELLAVRRDQLN